MFLSLLFNSLSLGVRLIVGNDDFFFIDQTVWDIYYIVNVAWRQCKLDSDKSPSNELWRCDTFWCLFSRHTMTHNFSSFVAQTHFWAAKNWKILARHESLLSRRPCFILLPPSSSWNSIIYWESRFLPSFFIRHYLITTSCTQPFYMRLLIFFMGTFTAPLLSEKSCEC